MELFVKHKKSDTTIFVQATYSWHIERVTDKSLIKKQMKIITGTKKL